MTNPKPSDMTPNEILTDLDQGKFLDKGVVDGALADIQQLMSPTPTPPDANNFYGNLIYVPPKRVGKIVHRYPGTGSDDLFEHILFWLNGHGEWTDKGKFMNW